MHSITFFPLGNADCFRIDLENGCKMLFDYANVRNPRDEDDRRIDLKEALWSDLTAHDRDYFDVTVFTHLDNDHYRGSSDFFYLKHDSAYQYGRRAHIREMWVPAAAITETFETEMKEAILLQKEARHRLIQGKGVRVFSRPAKLEAWLRKQGISLNERAHLITDAGTTVPGFTLEDSGIEFFVHSPFALRQDDGTLVDRNECLIVLQATFRVWNVDTRFLLMSDVPHEAIAEIVKVTRWHGNDIRLNWDIVKLPHHCSYLSLGPEKGRTETKPVAEIAWLYEEIGQQAGKIVSTSCEIPTIDTDQPPHRQAANYYKRCARDLGGEFLVTMQHPSVSAPEPLVIKIDEHKATVQKVIGTGVAFVTSRSAPRAG